jgi:Aspartyl/Asparaginyl beta-hydroxylase
LHFQGIPLNYLWKYPITSIAAMTAFLQLPLDVDLPGLLADLTLALAPAATWRPHYNARDYEGDWESIALRSADGLTTNVFAHPDAVYQDTPLLAQCPHFKALLDRLACDLESVRIMRQAAGGEIKTHRDQGLGYADGTFRIHVPLVTNPQVDFVVAGERLPMQPGECWFADFSQPHSVFNGGTTDRVHLVIDCIRNAWTDAWLEGAGFDMASLLPPPMPEAQRQQMLQALQHIDSPAATALVAQLQAESAAYVAEERLQKILAFLDAIGIAWRWGAVPSDTFLPGLEVAAGAIVIDRAQLRYPGDILHEAGHIALLPPEKRTLFTGNVKEVLPEHDGDEMAVILWTYAASLHLGLPLTYIIHDEGYKGSADWLREEFEAGNFIALPLLVWMNLCEDPKNAAASGREGFPRMLKWVR